MAKGAVFHHTQFQFHDGAIGDKYFVVLNEPVGEEPHVVAKTTSQLKDRTYNKGCNPKPGIFYVPGGVEKAFPVDTLIQLTDLYEFSSQEILKGHLTDKTISFRENLSALAVSQLVNCVKALKDDISEYHFKLITR